MSDIVPADQIEDLVGAKRHPVRHLGRAVSETQMVYILHSEMCLARNPDLRRCLYSMTLDQGIDPDRWLGWENRPVVLVLGQKGLAPLRGIEKDDYA